MTSEIENEVQRLTTDHLDIAKQFLSDGKSLPPTGLIFHGNNPLRLEQVLMPWNNILEKQVSMAMLVKLAIEKQAYAIVLIVDMYIRKYASREEARSADPTKPLKDDPERGEALTMLLSRRNGTLEERSFPYHREGDVIVWEPEMAAPSEIRTRLIPENWGKAAVAANQ